MSEKNERMENSRRTRLKNLTAKKTERGELEPAEEKELKRLTNPTLAGATQSAATPDQA